MNVLLPLRKLGDQWTVPQDVRNIIDAFTCFIFGYRPDTAVNVVPIIMLYYV